MKENGCADGYGREWSANELSMCAQEERQQEEMKRSRTKRIMKRSRTKRIMKMATTTIYNSAIQRNAMQCNGQGRMQDGRNGAEMVVMGPQCSKRDGQQQEEKIDLKR